MAIDLEKEDWRYFTMDTGELSAMITGILMTHKSFVVNLVIEELIFPRNTACLALEMDIYGWITSIVLEMKAPLWIVLIMDGTITTVSTMKTHLSFAQI